MDRHTWWISHARVNKITEHNKNNIYILNTCNVCCYRLNGFLLKIAQLIVYLPFIWRFNGWLTDNSTNPIKHSTRKWVDTIYECKSMVSCTFLWSLPLHTEINEIREKKTEFVRTQTHILCIVIYQALKIDVKFSAVFWILLQRTF